MIFGVANLRRYPPTYPRWAHGLLNAPGGNGAHPNDEIEPCLNECCRDWSEIEDDNLHYNEVSQTN